jgi:hypothetical protein
MITFCFDIFKNIFAKRSELIKKRFFRFWHAACNITGKHQKDALKKDKEEKTMGLLRGGLAAAGAWKLGGGLISTILIFLLLYWVLGFFMR